MKFTLFFILIIFPFLVSAQPFGNEWINYSQQYYKFPVVKDGVYRINRATLQNAGFPVGDKDPRTIQIFAKGKEIPIYITKGLYEYLFEENDYIEFYAEKNTGWLDTSLYDTPQHHLNPNYSLINDTIFYYITWNTSLTNLRYEDETDTVFSSYTPAIYCLRHLRWDYTSAFYSPEESPLYTAAEGWMDPAISADPTSGSTVTTTKVLSMPWAYSNGPAAKISFAFAAISNAALMGGVNHHIQVSLLNSLFDTSFTGRSVVRKTFNIAPALLAPSNNFSFTIVNDLGLASDMDALAFIDALYPHTFNFENASTFKFTLVESAGSKTYIQVNNFNAGGSLPVLYDMTFNKRIKVIQAGSQYQALIPNAAGKRNCILSSQSEITNVLNIVPVSASHKFTNYIEDNKNANYIIITHPSFSTSADEYKIYRDQTGYSAVVVNIEELYDQYSYGVNKHPLSIKNFIHTVLHNWDSVPKSLFMIGKSVWAAHYRTNGVYYAQTLVPSMGNPPSDVLLVSGLDNAYPNAPAIPVGRLSAQTNDQVRVYCNKVTEFESNQPAIWMKNVLHFGGGNFLNEQTLFRNYLNEYKEIIEGPLFGGHVTSFFKTSSDPIQITQSDTIKNLIVTGTSLLTFFGHASANSFDLSIVMEDIYNKARYPFVLANSCWAGDIHQPPSTSTSERWVFLANHGVIGFLASVGPGYTTYLNGYSTAFYHQIANISYGKPIGKAIQKTIQEYENSGADPSILITCLDFTLHGDPAIILNSHPKPDLTVTPSDISFDPANVTTEIDSFVVKIVITNIGRATTQEFAVNITRTFPDNTVKDTTRVVQNCYYQSVLFVKFPVDLAKGVGLNQFRVKVDAMNNVDEFNENNNEATVNLLIVSGDIIPVYPYNFAIYPDNTVTLKASTGYPFIGSQTYIFEMDTTDSYNSPQYISSPDITQSGGVVTWSPPLTLTANTVYYWRVSKKNSGRWKESSFIYIPGKTGWSQAHFFQFKNDEFNWINFNRTERKFDYISTPQELWCHNVGLASNNFEWSAVQWRINGNLNNGMGECGSCGVHQAMLVAVIDPVTLKAWPSNKFNWVQYNYYPNGECNNNRLYYVFFSTDNASLMHMRNMLTDIPTGYYILVYSFISGNFEHWPEPVYQIFEEELGASGQKSPRNVSNNRPYIAFFQKGYPDSTICVKGQYDTSQIDLNVHLRNRWYTGSYAYERIGPTHKWQSLHWDSKSIDPVLKDSIRLKVIGIKNSGATDTLLSLPKETTDVYNLYNTISASTYPYLKLTLITKDDSFKTPSQLKKWQIYHDGIPETAINPQKGYYFHKDTVNEEDPITFSVAFENISPYDFTDSLLVKYWIVDKNNHIDTCKYKRTKKHPAGSVIRDTVRFSTKGLPGLNSIWVEANPVNLSTGVYDQKEEYHFNNISQKFFYVLSDKANPLLDVTFDGVHILDGDIVSAKPEIVIKLKDENKYLALNDVSLFAIYVTSPSGTERRINLNNISADTLTFIKAQLPYNSCKINYYPDFKEDGKYKLRVQAKDCSNNESGQNDYVIDFEVINKASITEIFNYPNPFSTSTRFVFVLTGSELPTDFRIQILTVTGKLVKTIMLNDLGAIHIGTNKTQYAWDGTDDFGDKLANGVYFYHVITSIRGQALEKRETEADKYFKHGFGKLYIIR